MTKVDSVSGIDLPLYPKQLFPKISFFEFVEFSPFSSSFLMNFSLAKRKKYLKKLIRSKNLNQFPNGVAKNSSLLDAQHRKRGRPPKKSRSLKKIQNFISTDKPLLIQSKIDFDPNKVKEHENELLTNLEKKYCNEQLLLTSDSKSIVEENYENAPVKRKELINFASSTLKVDEKKVLVLI
jgi:hypothetical protein